MGNTTEEQIVNRDRKSKIVKNIKHNYTQIEESIVKQLYMKQDLHGTTIGSQREEIWRQLFEIIIPKKFVIEQSVFIIDSNKDGISKEVDLAIFDETYTPYIFQYGRIKFIPVEAVAAVVECKSQTLDEKTKKSIIKWCESIENLKTSKNSIARMAFSISDTPPATQQSTRPVKIFCGLKDNICDEIKNKFDFTLLASDKKESRISINVGKGCNNLEDWYYSLNHSNEPNRENVGGVSKLKDITLEQYRVQDEDTEISLLSFNLQLNQILMLINNPILFPHRAYADMFNGKGCDL